MKTKSDYPLIDKLGIKIIPENEHSPVGCDLPSLRDALAARGLWGKFCDQAAGSTMGFNGPYPWDVEAFLMRRGREPGFLECD